MYAAETTLPACPRRNERADLKLRARASMSERTHRNALFCANLMAYRNRFGSNVP